MKRSVMRAIITDDLAFLMDLGLLADRAEGIKPLVEYKIEPMGLTPLMVACCFGK